VFIALWDADIINAQDYYPFGMLLPNRVYQADSTGTGDYRYAFNGKEQDPEWDGNGNMYDYGFRIYNPRIAKFLSEDPLTSSYPWYTPYQFAGNMPIWAIDIDGLEEHIYTKDFLENGGQMVLDLINESEILKSYYVRSKDPEKTDVKIHFVTVSGLDEETKGQTFNINDYVKVYDMAGELIEKAEARIGFVERMLKADLTDAEREQWEKELEDAKGYLRDSKDIQKSQVESLEMVGLTIKQAKKAIKGKQVYYVGINDEHLAKNNSKEKVEADESLVNTTVTFLHEIVLHIVYKEEGGENAPKGPVEEHLKGYGLKPSDKNDQVQLIKKGYSPKSKDAKKGSDINKIHTAATKAVEKVNKKNDGG
ncbi:MAG: hypothetical protein KDC92_17390, partial [Bacteroidetes bacterium]|nr:hypothetical protein [Bacteroidota bacterium]